jgi:hypothetical protein
MSQYLSNMLQCQKEVCKCGVGLFGSIGAYDTYVGRFLVFRNVLFINEEQRVGAGGHVAVGSKSPWNMRPISSALEACHKLPSLHVLSSL